MRSSHSLHHTLRRTHWVWHLVLAAAVLLAQLAAARHSLQHLKRADPDAVHTVCVDCLALHAADHAGTATTLPPLLRAELPALTTPTYLADGHVPSPVQAYRSRAPPLLSV